MIRSHFSYCPLILMFSSRKCNNLINKLCEWSLRIVSGDNHSSFKGLLYKCKEVIIHQRNLQVLMTETCKIINGLSPPIMKKKIYYEKICTTWEIFKKYLIKIGVTVKTVKHGIETISKRTPFLWANIPNEYKLRT